MELTSTAAIESTYIDNLKIYVIIDFRHSREYKITTVTTNRTTSNIPVPVSHSSFIERTETCQRKSLSEYCTNGAYIETAQ